VLIVVAAGRIALFLLLAKNSDDKATTIVGTIGLIGLGIVLAILAAFIAICIWVAFA
jgi:hypothetical protein